jgi:hypothetical protein
MEDPVLRQSNTRCRDDVAGDIVIIAQTFLENYLNAFEYHRDQKVRAKLAEFTRWFEPDARVGLVTLLLTMKFCAVSALREVVRNPPSQGQSTRKRSTVNFD